MSLCINPSCSKPENPANLLFCQNCGSELLLEGRYRVTRLLGGGGFSRTYEIGEVRRVTGGGPSTLPKILKVLTDNQTKAIELFQREAEVLGRLQHPGIPSVEPDAYFTYSPRDSQTMLHCLVMEKVEGLDLQEYMAQRNYRPITQSMAIEWLTQLVKILHVVHQQHFFHRDIKPANIMLRPDGQLVLIDFGAARGVTETYLSKQAAHQVTGIMSLGYTPPEQLNGQAVLQSDFFALGRTFVLLLTGKAPNDQEIYDPYSDECRWRNYAPNLSPLLADLIDQMMMRLPSQRPANTEAILQRLAEIDRTLTPPAAPVPPTQRMPSPQPTKSAPSFQQPGEAAAPLPASVSAEAIDSPPLRQASRDIRTAWIAGIISGSLTLMFSLIGLLGSDLTGFGFGAWTLIDVVLAFGLTFGIYRRSRICAVIMLIYFLFSQYLVWDAGAGSVLGLVIALIFAYCYIRGIRGTFAYHRLTQVKTSAPPKPAS